MANKSNSKVKEDAFVLAVLTLAIGGLALSINNDINKLKDRKIKSLEQQLQITEENVIGQEAPEKFYEINGQRVYLEIDGKPIEEYFSNNY